MTNTQHYLIVGPCDVCETKECDCAENGVSPSPTLLIECPGVTDECMAWSECLKEHDDIDGLIDQADSDGEVEVHGETHKNIEGFCALDSCWFQMSDSLPYAADAAFLQKKKPMKQGRYPIDAYDPDFGGLEIRLLEVAS